MRQTKCGFVIKAKDEANRQKIGSLFMDYRGLGEWLHETEPGTWVTVEDEDYEPLDLKYETECLLDWFEQVRISLVTSGIEFGAELYGLNF